ncbi:MAG: FHA domain-containing protein [Planctomycetota bacterium]|nr:FHA domain-containing protein [Planctomycetota bacterium]
MAKKLWKAEAAVVNIDPSRVSPRLIVVDEVGRPVRVLSEGTTRIGRSRKNDLRLNDPSVSRFHCRIDRVGAVVRIHDASSENVTRVGRRQATGQILCDGDRIFLGRRRLEFRQSRASSPSSDAGKKKRPRALFIPTSTAMGWALSLLSMGLLFGVLFTTLFDLGRVLGEDESRIERASLEWKNSFRALESHKRDLRARLVRLEADLSRMGILESEKETIGLELQKTRQNLSALEAANQNQVAQAESKLSEIRAQMEVLEAEFEKTRNENLQLAEAMRHTVAERDELRRRKASDRTGEQDGEASVAIKGSRLSGENPIELAQQIRLSLEEYANPDVSLGSFRAPLDTLAALRCQQSVEVLYGLHEYANEELESLEKSIQTYEKQVKGYMGLSRKFHAGGGSSWRQFKQGGNGTAATRAS